MNMVFCNTLWLSGLALCASASRASHRDGSRRRRRRLGRKLARLNAATITYSPQSPRPLTHRHISLARRPRRLKRRWKKERISRFRPRRRQQPRPSVVVDQKKSAGENCGKKKKRIKLKQTDRLFFLLSARSRNSYILYSGSLFFLFFFLHRILARYFRWDVYSHTYIYCAVASYCAGESFVRIQRQVQTIQNMNSFKFDIY